MSSLDAITNTIKSYLATQYMYADEEWLSGCVEYLSQDPDNNYNETDMKNLAKEQWLLNDLKDICPGSLPANLKNEHKIILNGYFALQINEAIDIGTPAYQQYLKLQKVDMENIDATSKMDDKIPSHRMIKLYLTDGVQNICGIEYKPMRNLTCDITPGCKILVKGPVTCRRGTLLLTESVVQLLGGEVSESVPTHCLTALLCRKLGVTITLDTPRQQSRNSNIPQPHSEVPTSTINRTAIDDENPRPVARVIGIPVNTHIEENDIDFDEIAALEEEFTNDNNKRAHNASINENAGKKFKANNETEPNSTNVTTNIYERQNYSNGNTNTIDDYPTDLDFNFNEDEDPLRELELAMNEDRQEFPIKIQSEPFVYIKQLNSLDKMKYFGQKFNIKAQILKLLSKLRVSKDGWTLKCTLIDGTGCLDVDFTSDVLSKLVGYTPTEMIQLKKDMATNPELEQTAASALHKAKDTLQELNCIIEITLMETPKITSLQPFGQQHVASLKARLDRNGL